MNPRPVMSHAQPRRWAAGYTLVEILVAVTLTLILMGAVVSVFNGVGTSINNSRAALETFDRLRAAEALLRNDLGGVTVTMMPPRRPEMDEGYFEIIEGPVRLPGSPPNAVDSLNNNAVDGTVGDNDDILMFTTRTKGRPFVGKYGAGTLESDVAEVAWFLRGRTLHRRQLLVAPNAVADNMEPYSEFFAMCDVSARIVQQMVMVNSQNQLKRRIVGNTLGDLTKREFRFAHPYHLTNNKGLFPYDARQWGPLGLPTLCECSSNWMSSWATGDDSFLGTIPMPDSSIPQTQEKVDYWSTAATETALKPLSDNFLGTGSRIADDVVLTNVIGFDVKVWDPNANGTGMGDYMDLGYKSEASPDTQQNGTLAPLPTGAKQFNHIGYSRSLLAGSQTSARVYDSGSFHYEQEWVPGLDPRQDSMPFDAAINGFDDNNNGIVDDILERKTSPPYPAPLRGIQVKIRVFEPDSRQVREVTVVQDFLPK